LRGGLKAKNNWQKEEVEEWDSLQKSSEERAPHWHLHYGGNIKANLEKWW